MNNSDYSVLMSVYKNDNTDFLKQSIDSILNQTVPTDDFVIVIDGPISDEISNLLNNYREISGGVIKLVPFKENRGLGKALCDGITYCTHDIVMRQDGDDISLPNRAEIQLKLMADTSSDIVSGTVSEFEDDTSVIKGARVLPSTHEEILKFSKKRNPFNHPAVLFKKNAVIEAGNYSEEYHLFEDYYLWIRMLMAGFKGSNTRETVVYMRVDGKTMLRRGGKKYASDMISFHKWLRNKKWSSTLDFLTGAVPHYIVCIMPSSFRGLIYKFLH